MANGRRGLCLIEYAARVSLTLYCGLPLNNPSGSTLGALPRASWQSVQSCFVARGCHDIVTLVQEREGSLRITQRPHARCSPSGMFLSATSWLDADKLQQGAEQCSAEFAWSTDRRRATRFDTAREWLTTQARCCGYPGTGTRLELFLGIDAELLVDVWDSFRLERPEDAGEHRKWVPPYVAVALVCIALSRGVGWTSSLQFQLGGLWLPFEQGGCDAGSLAQDVLGGPRPPAGGSFTECIDKLDAIVRT